MKFTSYQSNAQVGAPNTGLTNFHYSNQGAMAAAKESNAIGQTIATGGMAIVDKVNTFKAMDANNYYNQRMTEESTDLINNHKEGEALNITGLYDQKQKQVMEETQKKFGNFISFGKGAESFNEFTTRDNFTRRTNIEKYQVMETEKYEETTTANQIKNCMLIPATAGYTAESMNEGFNRIDAIMFQRYGKYGEERVKYESQKQHTAYVKAAIDAMYAKDDYERAEMLEGVYDSDLTPEMRNAYNKINNVKRKEDYSKKETERLIAAFGKNPGQIQNALNGSKAFGVEGFDSFTKDLQNQGVQYILGGNGQNGYDCGLYTKQAAAAGGFMLDSRTADGQCIEMEQKGMFTPNKDEAGAYSLVFWHTGNWEATDNPAEGGDSGGKAYKGIDHVGILMPDGKVMQMGNHGLKEIDLDTYQVVGYGRMSSGSYSEDEKDTIMKRVFAKINEDKAIRRANIDNMTDQFRQKVIAMKNQGMGGLAIYDSLTSGVADPDTRDAIMASIRAEALSMAPPSASRSRGGGSGYSNKSLGDDGKAALADYIKSGNFDNKAALINALSENGFGKTAIDQASRMWDDYVSNKGLFKFDMDDMANQAVDSFSNLKGERRSKMKQGLKLIGTVFVNKYRAEHNGSDPDDSDVLEAMINSNSAPLTYNEYKPKGNWLLSERFQATPAELAGIGVQRLAPVEGRENDNEYYKVYYDGRSSEWTTGNALDDELGR